MAVYRAHITKAQLLKHRPTDGHMFDHITGPFRPFPKRARQKRHGAFGCGFKLLEGRACIELAQIGGERSHRRGNRHFIIVENNDHAFFKMTRIVHSLKCHARTHRAVANHRNCIPNSMFRCAAQIARHSKAQRRRNGCGRMRCTKGIIIAFTALGEATETIFLPKRSDAIAPTS